MSHVIKRSPNVIGQTSMNQVSKRHPHLSHMYQNFMILDHGVLMLWYLASQAVSTMFLMDMINNMEFELEAAMLDLN